MIARIDAAKAAGDTLGGVVEVIALGLPVGLGSHVSWDAKLDGRVAQALMSIPAVKGVELGLGFEAARRKGSEVHDEILPGLARATNRAGGTEGGMTTGEPLVARVAMKPISTLMAPLRTVDLKTGGPAQAQSERSDVTAVPAMGVIAEPAVTARGGGWAAQPGAIDSAKSHALVIYLYTRPETAAQRAGTAGTRPLLSGEDPVGRMRQLHKEREPFYRNAHAHVDTDRKSAQQAVIEVVRLAQSSAGW